MVVRVPGALYRERIVEKVGTWGRGGGGVKGVEGSENKGRVEGLGRWIRATLGLIGIHAGFGFWVPGIGPGASGFRGYWTLHSRVPKWGL